MGQFRPKFCSYVSRRGWIRLWPAGLNWPWAETDLFKFQFNNWTDIIQWCTANCSRLRLECFSCIKPLELLLIELRTEWHTCYSFLGSVSVSMATVIGKLGNAIKSINHICGCKIPYNVHRRVAPYHHCSKLLSYNRSSRKRPPRKFESGRLRELQKLINNS